MVLVSQSKSLSASLTEEQIKETFKRHDVNHDGLLSKQELKNTFESLGSKGSGYRASRALYHADANKDGYINEEELNRLIKYAVRIGYTIK
ncbi:hypothetical protein I3843_15G055200 [Carya illinoinensis]|nr:hypothetical protein I3843_15G055200 [Carya illinoinensis]